MTPEILDTFWDLAVLDKAGRVDAPAPTLQTDERAALAALTGTLDGHHAQLEQERLPADVVLDHLAQTFAVRDRRMPVSGTAQTTPALASQTGYTIPFN